MAAIVYLATNRINGKRYVGVTQRALEARRREHELHALNGKRIQCRVFHAAIREHGVAAFDWIELAACPSFEQGLSEERRQIAAIRPEYNLTVGGQGVVGRVVSAETRAKISAANKGRKQTPEQKAKQIAAMLGRTLSPETKAKISAKRKGGKFSAEHRRNLSLARQAYRQSPETIQKAADSRRGRALSAGHRAKISVALMGHPGANLGKKFAPEIHRKHWETRRRKAAEREAVNGCN